MSIISMHDVLSFIKPKLKLMENSDINNNCYNLQLEPLETGIGHTLGNALRRIMLGFIPGCAITEVEIEGIQHIYNNKKGIKEDILEVLLNLKDVIISMPYEMESQTLHLNKKGIGAIYAGDIQLPDSVKVINPNQLICHITDDNVDLNMSMKVNWGVGYFSAGFKKSLLNEDLMSRKLLIEAYFSPIKKVKYTVNTARLLDKSDLDSLILEIETNGSISGLEALRLGSTILYEHIKPLININFVQNTESENKISKTDLLKPLKELQIPVRALNCLHHAKINLIGELIQQTEQELLKLNNLGKKSLNDIKKVLSSLGLSLGLKLKDWDLIKEKKDS